ncbi:MAG: LSM domain-containing protein [Nitrosopumilaceae archaeon]
MSSEIDKILDSCINKIILIKLKNRTILRANLKAYDQHMNLILTEVEDITEDKVKNLDKIILRGDNILIVSPHEK